MSSVEGVWDTVVTRLRGTRARSRGSLATYSRHLLKTSALSTAALVFSGIAAQGGQDGLWQPQVRAIIGADNHGANAALEGFVPLKQTAESVLFLDVRGKHDFEDGFGQDIGLGIRRIVNPDLLLGGYVYVNVQNHDGHRFTGATLGAEAITTNFDAHVNVFLPIGGDTTTHQASTGLSLVGNQLLEQVSVLDRRNYAAWGIEGEVGVQVPVDLPANHSLRLSVGGYHFGDPDGNDKSVTGAKAGLEYSIHDVFGSGTNLTFAGEIRNDNRYDTTFNGSVQFSIPFNAPDHGSGAEDEPEPIYPVSSGLRKRVNERVRGDIGVRIATQESRTSSSRVAINATTNTAFGDFFFADGDNTLGLGTLGDPTTLDDAVAKAKSGGFIVALGGKPTNIRTDGAVLFTNQTVMGGQQSVKVKTRDGSTVDFAPAGAGGSDGTIEGTNPAANVLTLADHNTLQGIFVTGGKNGVSGNDITGATLTNLTVSGAGESGVSFTGTSTGITGSGLTSKNNGVDGLHIEGDGTFNFTGTTLLFGNLDDGTDIAGHGTYTFATLNAQDNGDAGITVKGTNVSGTFSTTGGTVSGNQATGDDKVGVFIDPITAHVVLDGFTQDGGTSGIVLDHASGSFTVAGKTSIVNTSGAGIVISDSPASVRFGDVEITAPGTDAIAFKGVNATVFAGNIVVAGLGTGAGLDFLNSQTTFTAQSLNVTGTGSAGSIGIDLSGSLAGASVIVTDGGVIANVDTGVRLGIAGSKANTANAEFSFGGGSIGGITAALDMRGLNPVSGHYAFAATVFDGPQLFDPTGLIFVGSAGTGDGSSMDDLASVATAKGIADADAIFVLVNDGVIDVDGGWALHDGQTVASFGNGRTFVSGGAPANVAGDNVTTAGGVVSDARGAATLTNLGDPAPSSSTLHLANGNFIADVIVADRTGHSTIQGIDINGFTGTGITVTGGTVGLQFNNISGTISLSGTTIGGMSGAGITVTTSSAAFTFTNTSIDNHAATGAGILLNSNTGTVSFNGGLAIETREGMGFSAQGGGTVNVAASAGDESITTSAGQALSLNGINAGISFDTISSTGAAGDGVSLGAVSGTFAVTGSATVTNVGRNGINLNGNSATISFTGTSIAGSAGTGIVVAGSTDSVTFTNTTIDNSATAGGGVSLSSNTGTVSFNGGLAIDTREGTGFSASGGGTVNVAASAGGESIATSAGQALGLDGINADISFDTISSTGAGGAGVSLVDLSGSVAVGQASVDNAAGTGVNVAGGNASIDLATVIIDGAGSAGITVSNTAGAVTLGSATISNVGGVGFSLSNTTGGVSSGAIAINNVAGVGIDLSGNGGSIGFGAATISGSGGDGVSVSDNAGPLSFASLAITDAGAAGLRAGGTNGTVTIDGTTSIADAGGNAIDLTAASGGALAFGDIDVTGLKAATTGLALSGGKATFVANSLDITGTGAAGSIGVDLSGSLGGTSVIITGGGVIANVDTGVQLGTYGAGVASANATLVFDGGTIGGSTAAIDTRGLDPNPLSGSYDFGATAFAGPILFDPSNVIFVGAATAGTGDGSSIDNRTTIDQADANTDADAVFVLVNRGVIDDTNGFSLSAGQTLGSFGNGKTYVLTGVPINVTGDNIAHGTTVGDAGGAATLTSSGVVDTLTLGGGNLVNDVIIDNSGGGFAIYGSGIADFTASGVTVTGTGIGIELDWVAGGISLDNTTVSGARGINIAHSSATIDFTGTTTITAGSGVGLALADTSGLVTIADLTVSAGTDAVQFDSITSTVDVAKLAVTGGQNGIHIFGAGGAFTFGTASSITGTTGTAFLLDSSSSTVDYGGSIDVHSQAVSISGLGLGSVSFGGLITADSGAAGAVALDSNTGGTISFAGGLKLTSDTAPTFGATNGGTVVVTGADNDLTAGAATALQLGGVAAGAGGINFDRLVSTGGGVGLDLASVDTSAGNIAVNGVAFSNQTSNGISATDIGGNGSVTVGGGTISTGDPSGIGVFIGGVNTATLNFGTASGGLDIEGGPAGVVVNQSGGANTINFGTGAGSLTIGATTPPTSSGVLVLGLDAGTNVAIGNSTNASTINTNGTGISLTGAGNLSVANTAIQGSGGGFDAIDYAGIATLTNVGISGVGGANDAFQILQNANTGTFDVTGLTVSNPVGAATGGGISISQNGSGAVRFALNAGDIASPGTALTSTDGGVAGSVVLAIANTNFATSKAGSKAINVTGSGLNSTIVTAFDGNTVIGNGTGGGIFFSRVTFDESGTALADDAVTGAGITQIGQGTDPAQRVAGNGLTLINPTGSLSFGTLNIFNDGGDGLSVDTKTLGTTFTLGTTTGTIDTTNGTAVYLDPLTVAMTLASVNSTNASDNGIILDQVAGSFTVQGGTISDSTNDGVIVVNSAADTSFTGMSVLRAGGAGFYILDPQGGATTTINATVTDAAFSAIEFSSDTAGSNGSIAVTGGTYISQDSAFLSAPSTPVLPGPVSTLNIAITGGTFASSTGGLGIEIATCGCTDINITDLSGITVNTPGLASGGILISGAKFDVATPGAIRIGTSADPASGSGLALFAVTGTLDISQLDIVSAAGAPALAAIGVGPADFSLAIATGTITATDAGAIALGDLTADVSFTAVTSNSSTTDGISLVDVAGSFTVTGATAITNAAGAGISVGGSSAAITFAGTTVSDVGADGILLSDNSGSVTFGDVSIANPGLAGDSDFDNGINVEGINGTISFANIDITGIGELQTGLDLSGSKADFTALSLDITGTGSATATGIDLSGTQSGSRTTITNGGTIQAVGTGAQLGTHGAGVASANDVFTFGGGSISGSVASLDTRGLAAGNGTYSFAGTVFNGPQLFDGNNVIFVGAAATGLGDGSSMINLANIDTADANTSATAIFALVNNGTIGSANGFTLDSGQSLVSFGNGNTVNAAGVPINVTGTNVETGGLISDSRGAATLVRGNAGDVVTLGGGNTIDDVIIANTNGSGAAVFGTGISDLSSSGATLSGADYGLQLVGVSGTVALDNLTAGADHTGIQIVSSPATIDFTGTTTLVAGTGAGIDLKGANGAVTISDMSIDAGSSGDAFLLDGVTSNVDATRLTVTQAATGIHVVNASTGAFTFGPTSSITGTTVSAFTLAGSAATVTYDGTIDTTSGQAVSIGSLGAGSVSFGGLVTASSGAASAVELANNTGGTISFAGGLKLTSTSGNGFSAHGGGTLTVTGTDNDVTSGTGVPVDIRNMTVGMGGIAFDQLVADGSPVGLELIGDDVSAGSINVANVDFAGITMIGIQIQDIKGSRSITVGGGSIGLAGSAVGVSISGTTDTATYNIATAAGGLTIDGGVGSTGIVVDDAGTATINIGTGAGSLAIGGTARTGAGIRVDALASAGSLTVGNATHASSIKSIGTGITVAAATAGDVTFVNTAIDSSAGSGIAFADYAGTATLTDVSISGMGGVAIGLSISQMANTGAFDVTGLTISNYQAGATGGGVSISEDSTGMVRFSLAGASRISSAGNAFDSFGQSQTAASVILAIDDTTFETTGAGSQAVNVANLGGLTATIVTSLDGNTVVGNGFGGGMIFGRVVFDASGAALTGTQVVSAGTTQIGQDAAHRVKGDGLSLSATGNLSLGTLTVFNSGGTGLEVGTPEHAPTMIFGTDAGTLDTDGASAINISQATLDVTLNDVTSTNSAFLAPLSGPASSNGMGIDLDSTAGSLTVTGTTTISGSAFEAIYVGDSSLTATFDTLAVATGTNNGGLRVLGGSADVSFGGSITQDNRIVAAVVVQDGHTGTITQTGGTITATNGSGLQFQNADGTYTFNGTVTLDDTGKASGVGIKISDDSDGTFTFADVTITNTAAATPSGTAIALSTDALRAAAIGVDIWDSPDAVTTFRNLDIISAADIGVAARNGGILNIGAAGNTSTINAGIGLFYYDTSGSVTNAAVTAGTVSDPGLLVATATGNPSPNFKIGRQTGIQIVTDQKPTSFSLADSTIFGAGGVFSANIGAFDSGIAIDRSALRGDSAQGIYIQDLPGSGNSYVTSLDSNTSDDSSSGFVFENVIFDKNPATLLRDTVTGGTTSLGMTTRLDNGGLMLLNAAGSLAFDRLDIANDAEIGLQVIGSGAVPSDLSLNIHDGSIDTTHGQALMLANAKVDVTLASVSSTDSVLSTLAIGDGVTLQLLEGKFAVTGATTITNAALDGIRIAQTTTTAINFGATTISLGSIGDAGIGFFGTNGDVSFGTTTVSNIGNTQTGIDFSSSETTADFGLTTITGTVGSVTSRGIDLSSTIGNRTISFLTGSAISGVAIGVDLSSGETTATSANAAFTFGDGDATVPNGRNSTISATKYTVNTVGLDPASGSYDFDDVAFTGNANLATIANSAILVSQSGGIIAAHDAANGNLSVAAKTISLNEADANPDPTATFAFVGTIDLGLAANTTFTLQSGQTITGFGNGNTVASGTFQPANVSGALGALGGSAITGDAGIVEGGSDLMQLFGDNQVRHTTFDFAGAIGAAFLIDGSAAGFSTGGITVEGVTIRNVTAGQSAFAVTGLDGNLSIVNNTIDIVGKLIDVNGGSGTISVTRGTLPNSATAGTLTAGGIAITGRTGGAVTFTDQVTINGGGVAISGGGAAAAVNFNGGLDITTATATGLDFSGFNVLTVADAGSTTIETTSGTALSLRGVIGAGGVNFDSVVSTGAAGQGVAIDKASGGAVNLDRVTVTGSADVGIDIYNSHGTFTFGATTVTNTGPGDGAGISIDNSASPGTTNVVVNGTMAIATNSGTGLQVVGGATPADTIFATSGVDSKTITTSNGTAVVMSSADVAAVLTSVTATFSSGSGINLQNLTGSLAINGGTLTDNGPGSAAFIVGSATDKSGGTATISYAGDIVSNGNAAAVSIQELTGGSVTLSGNLVDIVNTGGGNIVIANIDNGTAATVTFSGASKQISSSTTDAVSLTNNPDGTIAFTNGGLAIATTNGTGFLASGGGTINVMGTSNTVTTGTGSAVSMNGVTAGAGGVNFGIVSTTGAALGIGLTNVASSGGGAFNLGATTLTGITSTGVDITGTLGAALNFDSLDIRLAANATGFDLSAAAVNADITAGDFDVDGNNFVGTLGINVAGTTTPAGVTIQLGNTDNGPLATQTSTIANVGTGILFSGGTNAHLVFGDGLAPAESSIATFGGGEVIKTLDTLPTVGDYNFNDVNFTGDTSSLESSVTYYYVDNVADGIDDGTRAHPGTIAGALGSAAKVIVLVNNGGTIDMNGSSLTLDDGQALIGFRDGAVDITTLGLAPGGAPSSFSFSTINSGTIVTDPTDNGAVTLTTNAFLTPTVVLTGSNGISGVVIANNSLFNGFGIGGTNISALTLLNSTVGGGPIGSGVSITSTAATVLALSNLTLKSGAGIPALSIDGSGGTTTITRFDRLNVEGGGIVIKTVTFDADPTNGTIDAVSGGNSIIGTALNRVSGSGLSLTNVSGELDYAALNIANNGGTGLIIDNDANNDGVKDTIFTLKNTGGSIDTTNGAAMNLDPLTVDLTFASITAGGGASGIIFDGVAGTVTVSGATTIIGTSGYGISAVHDNSGGTFNFNGAVTIDNNGAVGLGGGISWASGTLTMAGQTAIETTSNAGISQSGGTANSNGGLTVATDTGTGIGGTGGALNIAATGTRTVNSTGGTAIDLSAVAANIALQSTSSGGGVNNVSLNNVSGAVTLGTGTLTGATGTAFDVSGGTVSATYSGGITQASNAAMVSALNHSAGTLEFNTGTLDATVGTGLQFSNADGTYKFLGTTTLHGGDAGIDIVGGSQGAFTFGSDTSIVNPSGIGFNVDGAGAAGNGNITYNGTVSKNGTGGALVNVQGRSDGTVAFNGALSASGSVTRIVVTNNSGTAAVNFAGLNTLSTGSTTAVNLSNNAGATISFSGGLAIDTTSGTGFNATGGGTVTVQGSNNTITSTNGTALNVANTTIGSAGLTFKSISSSFGANGIVLDHTGALGGLTVTGVGTTAGSGGTIQNTTGRGASFINASNITLKNMNFTNAGTTDLAADNSGLSTGLNLTTNAAIHLVNVATVTLDRIAISGGAEQGINGNTVSNFTLSNSSISNIGNAADEDGIHFYNMSGTSAITDTTINGSGDDNLNLQMQSGTLSLTITGGSATNGVLGGGYLFGIHGTANATIDMSGIISNTNLSGGVVADAYDTSTMKLRVDGSTISGNNDGISVSANQSADVKLDVTNNTLSSVAAGDFSPINILGAAFATGASSFDARVQNNNITVANGLTTDGMTVFNAGGGALNVGIFDNSFDYAGTQLGILIQAGQDGNGSTRATVTGNAMDIKLDGAGNAVGGILAQNAITGPGNTSSMDLNIGGAGAQANAFTHSLGGTIAAGDIRVRQRNNGTFNLDGYGGGATDAVAVAAYLNARNSVASASTATAQSTGFTGNPTPTFTFTWP